MKFLALAIFAIVSVGSFAAQARDLPPGYRLLAPGKVEVGVDGDVVFQVKEAAARAIEKFIPTKYSDAYESQENMNMYLTMARRLRTTDIVVETWEKSALTGCRNSSTYGYVDGEKPNLLILCPRVSKWIDQEKLGIFMQFFVHESYHMYTEEAKGPIHLFNMKDKIQEEGDATIVELQIIRTITHLAGHGGCVFHLSYAASPGDVLEYIKREKYPIPKTICRE